MLGDKCDKNDRPMLCAAKLTDLEYVAQIIGPAVNQIRSTVDFIGEPVANVKMEGDKLGKIVLKKCQMNDKNGDMDMYEGTNRDKEMYGNGEKDMKEGSNGNMGMPEKGDEYQKVSWPLVTYKLTNLGYSLKSWKDDPKQQLVYIADQICT